MGTGKYRILMHLGKYLIQVVIKRLVTKYWSKTTSQPNQVLPIKPTFITQTESRARHSQTSLSPTDQIEEFQTFSSNALIVSLSAQCRQCFLSLSGSGSGSETRKVYRKLIDCRGHRSSQSITSINKLPQLPALELLQNDCWHVLECLINRLHGSRRTGS